MLGVTSLCSLVLHSLVVDAFNLSPAVVFKGDANQRGDYFGYSVALQRRTLPYGHWVIVGAPRANSSTQRTVVEPGVAYECSTDTTDCTTIDLGTLDNPDDSENSTVVYKSKEDNAWIGGAIDVQDHNDGRVAVCGPRSVNHYFNRSADPDDGIYRMIGVCFVKDYDTSSSVEGLTPLNDRTKFTANLVTSSPGRNSTSYRGHFYEQGAAGSSVHFSKNSKELLFGAPGVLQWRGTMIRYLSTQSLKDNPVVNKNNKMYGSPLIPHPEKTSQLTNDGYFGYSVDSGALYMRNLTSYVGGAPRAAALKGKVFVFNFPELGKSNYTEFKVLAEIEGTQMGEYFGAAVCAVDLNGDGLDDLVVGAPLYTVPLNYPSQLRSSEGRVYVFINSGQGIFTATKYSILGSHINGRFGSAISKIGDMNKDGFNDIAVGAPYAHVDGNGAIYIYHGGSSGVSPQHRQLITAESVSTGLSGFGISISRGLDVDGNGYNDIAVGAYTSGHVVLLTSRAVVTLRPSLAVKNSSGDSTHHYIDKTATSFVVLACMDYSGSLVPDTVYVRIKLTADPRTRFVDKDHRSKTITFNSVLKRNKTECKDVTVDITKPENFPTPLEMSMNFQLDASKGVNNSLGFCSDCPVVDPDSPEYASWTLPFVTERTDLKIKVDFGDPTITIVLGTQPRLPMKIRVTNNGQSAFRTTIKVTLPPSTSLLEFGGLRWTKHQNTTYTTVECDLQDVDSEEIKVEELWVILDTADVKEGTRSLSFGFEVGSAGAEQNPSDNFETVSLATKMEADVFVTGISNQIHEKISAGEKQNFSHTYIVKSFGPSALGVLKLTFHLPIALRTSDGVVQLVKVYKPELTLDNQPFQCTHAEGPDFTPHEDESVVEDIQRRSLTKRSTSVMNLAEDYDVTQFPSERTLVVNCSSENTECLTVECLAGPFAPNRSTAIISFRMEVNFTNIGPILADRDILVISSTGRVTLLTEEVTQPSDHRPDVSTVSTTFFGEKPTSHVDQAIFYGSIAGGVLILIIIVIICWKVGFFKRPEKEELTAQQNAVDL